MNQPLTDDVTTQPHIMILAGETSGDQHGAEMVKEIVKVCPQVKLTGMGSHAMRDAGVSLFFDSESIAVMGIVEVLKKWSEIKAAMNLVKAELKAQKPDLLICIDYQEFNSKMATYAKSLGIKVLFYISPQVWAWRPKRVKKIGQRVDHMAVIFPFEVDFYRKHHIPVTYVGHPLVDKVIDDKSQHEAQSLLGLSGRKKVIGLFPGSRQSELERLMPTMLQAAELLQKQYADGVEFVLPVADSLDMNQVKQMVLASGLEVNLVTSELYSVIKSCDAIISCSGTVTLEIALLGVPLCVIYKVSWLTYQIMSRMMIIEHVCLVNIVAKKQVVKEMLQQQANSQSIAHEIMHILDDDVYRTNMQSSLLEVKRLLGDGGGSKNIAKLALSLL